MTPNQIQKKIQEAINEKHAKITANADEDNVAQRHPDVVRQQAESAFSAIRKRTGTVLANTAFDPGFYETETGQRLQGERTMIFNENVRMIMRDQTWQALEDFFSEYPVLKAEPVKSAEVTAAERKIGIPLPEDYKEFIRRYGGAIVGPFSIFGLRHAEPMGDDESSFLEVTRRFREDHWPDTDKWVIISTDFDGNPVGLDAEGKVWISDHDVSAIQPLAPSFEAYLRKLCLELPD